MRARRGLEFFASVSQISGVEATPKVLAMKQCIAADGPERFAKNAEYLARRAELQEAVEAKYAAQLAEAGFFRRLLLRYARRRELRRELRKITPSAQSCWLQPLDGTPESRIWRC